MCSKNKFQNDWCWRPTVRATQMDSLFRQCHVTNVSGCPFGVRSGDSILCDHLCGKFWKSIFCRCCMKQRERYFAFAGNKDIFVENKLPSVPKTTWWGIRDELIQHSGLEIIVCDVDILIVQLISSLRKFTKAKNWSPKCQSRSWQISLSRLQSTEIFVLSIGKLCLQTDKQWQFFCF